MAAKVAIVILAHDNRSILEEMIQNLRYYCPHASLFVYNSGSDPHLVDNLKVKEVPIHQPLSYARICPFFFDLFDWFHTEGMPFDYITNLDSDVLFIRHGFEDFLCKVMEGFDYMAPKFQRQTPKTSKWRPYRSLRPELQEWFKVWGFTYTNEAFNPGQTFSCQYVTKLWEHDLLPQIRALVACNQSFTLHEVLFPTLVDFLGLKGRSYPIELLPTNRYRPYQAVTGIKRALSLQDAYFVHPVRRIIDDPARVYVRSLTRPIANEV